MMVKSEEKETLKLRIRETRRDMQDVILEVPIDTDFTVMIENDRKERQAVSDEVVVPRAPQEILSDIYRESRRSTRQVENHFCRRSWDDLATVLSYEDALPWNDPHYERHLILLDVLHECLSEKQQELIQKRFVERLQVQEIAKQEGVSVGAISHRWETVKKQLIRIFSEPSKKKVFSGYMVRGNDKASGKE